MKSIAFYLPQYHPIPENDLWWGNGFTEWTNVGKAKPLFPGHYQPHVPADLGYYDLRVPDSRIKQANLAQSYGIDAFCYWNYWFGNGKKLLNLPIDEVVRTGEPNFPFCLGWANHSWEAKNWSTKKINSKILIQQLYPGVDDAKFHFFSLLHIFKDKRYLKHNGKPIFVIWDPLNIPNNIDFVNLWNDLAIENGLNGFTFIGFTYNKKNVNNIYKLGFDYVTYDALLDVKSEKNVFTHFMLKVIRELFQFPIIIDYKKYAESSLNSYLSSDIVPCILPNYDHTPRSGKRGLVLRSSPDSFESHLIDILNNMNLGKIKNDFLFIKSWNEWGEGNHLEPDLRFSHDYLKNFKFAIDNFKSHQN
jgi:hypothetical protein